LAQSKIQILNAFRYIFYWRQNYLYFTINESSNNSNKKIIMPLVNSTYTLLTYSSQIIKEKVLKSTSTAIGVALSALQVLVFSFFIYRYWQRTRKMTHETRGRQPPLHTIIPHQQPKPISFQLPVFTEPPPALPRQVLNPIERPAVLPTELPPSPIQTPTNQPTAVPPEPPPSPVQTSQISSDQQPDSPPITSSQTPLVFEIPSEEVQDGMRVLTEER
jgi:hypothetical protein